MFTIYQLKRAGIRHCDLFRVYVSVIRPVLEYACPVWHTSLPTYLSDNIETIQKRCLRTIFPGHSYDEARSISNLPTLFERRTKLCQSYFRKMHNADHKFFSFRVLHTMFSHLRAHAFARSVTVARSSAVQASSSRRQERRWAIVCGSPQSQSTDCAQSVKGSPTEPGPPPVPF